MLSGDEFYDDETTSGLYERRWSRPAYTMTEAELIAAHGGLPTERQGTDTLSVRELEQRAAAARVLQREGDRG